MPFDAVSYVYAAVVAGGGIFGYVKAGEFNFGDIFIRAGMSS